MLCEKSSLILYSFGKKGKARRSRNCSALG